MLFFSCHLDGTAVCLAEPRGGWDISGVRSQGQSTRCRVLDAPDAGVGALVGGCLVVVLPVVSASLRVGVYGLSVGLPRTRVWGPLWAGVGTVLMLSCRYIPLLGGVASESMVSLFYAPDANAGTLMGGCLDVVVPAASLRSAPTRRSLRSLRSLPYDAGVGILEPVGGCLDVVVPAVSLPSASSCRSRRVGVDDLSIICRRWCWDHRGWLS